MDISTQWAPPIDAAAQKSPLDTASEKTNDYSQLRRPKPGGSMMVPVSAPKVNKQDMYQKQGVVNVPFLGITNITFKYLLEILSPIIHRVMFNSDIYQPLKKLMIWCQNTTKDRSD